MEEISKKELLQLTGISYGQLYRWKRKGLIPEEWFVKRASYTGQETYFPKDLILDRIDKILELKDEKSLEDISDIINHQAISSQVTKEALTSFNVLIHKDVLDLFQGDTFTLEDIVIIKIIDQMNAQGITTEQLKGCVDYLLLHKKDITTSYAWVYVIKMGETVSFILLKDKVELEYNTELIIKISLKSIIENLKLLLFV
jgi:DNA-binding transcriptional MerR regulator